ncbi:hypothetical protein [Mameliella alba]|uniref:hypothetical protein n=1 Tax=Mameliella alba TaxID=561184 RepID=UPI0008411F66|nr:hypothetical protein [Mameliella alba]MBY6121459.1 hypothetical protein [Mameliella alba]ODM49495.1 hypothetical protein A9320_14630 [Ruegeria sp. PBVC088]OWV41258.1 hypothetical protein CDZ95_17890 [Mameliella alba]OWV54638.1 hypothetical protein CDZ97_23910 [Mameliella alba]
MKPTLEDLLAGVPARDGNGGTPLAPSVSASKAKTAEPVTQIDKTTANAKRVLDEEAQARADKTAQLKAAREARDGSGNT